MARVEISVSLIDGTEGTTVRRAIPIRENESKPEDLVRLANAIVVWMAERVLPRGE